MEKDKFLGIGLELKSHHCEYILKNNPRVDWFEINSEDFMVEGGQTKKYLQQIREKYPLSMHGVSLDIGSTDPVDMNYLKELKYLIAEVQPDYVSDHLSWSAISHVNSHEHLPLPFNEEVISHVVQRIDRIQDYLGRQILLENVPCSFQYKYNKMSEWDFLNKIAAKAGCKLLLNLNAVLHNSQIQNFSTLEFLKGINKKHIQELHLGSNNKQGYELYREILKTFGPISTAIESESKSIPFSDFYKELMDVKKLAADTFGVLSKQVSHVSI